jgi:hypothetical protein
MTILSAIQSASAFLGIDVPSAVMASTDREHVELAAVANDMAKRIAEAHEWQVLKRQQTITGNGETDAWDLPSDFDRMPLGQRLWTSRTTSPLRHIEDEDEWLGYQVTSLTASPYGSWTMVGGQLVFDPVLASAETVKYYYLTNLIATNASGTNIVAFTADTDTFRLDEGLLRLAIIWKWRDSKGHPADVALAEFQTEMTKRTARDGHKEPIRIGRARMSGEIALPWTIEP